MKNIWIFALIFNLITIGALIRWRVLLKKMKDNVTRHNGISIDEKFLKRLSRGKRRIAKAFLKKRIWEKIKEDAEDSKQIGFWFILPGFLCWLLFLFGYVIK